MAKVELTDEQKQNSEIYVNFVNILFAVILGQSFPLMTERVVRGDTSSATFMFDSFMMILMYVIVALSWFGYHTSTSKHPLLSVWRVFIDMLIVFLYYLGFVFATSVTFFIYSAVFSAIFLTYLIWDLVKIWEYGREGHKIEPRWITSAGAFFLTLTVLAILMITGGVGMYLGLGLGMQYFITIGYRAIKMWKD